MDIFGKNFAGKVQCCKFGASLNLDLYIVGSCGFASVLLMHFDNCPFARQNFLKILDGGTASHLQSLLLTNPPLDLRWRTTSFTIIAFFLGRCTSLYSLFLYASSGFAGNPDPIFCEISALAIKFID